MRGRRTGTDRNKKGGEERASMDFTEFLKKSLGGAYTEELGKQISEGVGKYFTSRADFNTVNEEKKALEQTIGERDKQLEALKQSGNDAEGLKGQIEALQQENKAAVEAHTAEVKRLKREAIDTELLTAQRARNMKMAKALLSEADPALDDEAYRKAREKEIKTLTEAEDTKFAFADAVPKLKGTIPGQGKDETFTDAGDWSVELAKKAAQGNKPAPAESNYFK